MKNSKLRASVVRGLLGAALALSLAPAIAAAQEKPLIAASVADQKSLFYIAAVDGMRDAAKEAGLDLNVASASNSSREQINQVQNLLVQQPKALLFISQDSTAAAASVKAANNAEVPVIAVDQRPESGSGELVTFIATDSVKAARDLCTWLFDKMGGSGEIAILKGVLGSTAEQQRTQGCEEALKNYPDIKVVAVQAANWDENEAFAATQNILTANPNLKAVFGESDAMSLGAAKAARQAGRDDLLSVGIDGFPTMFKAIKSGLTQATMAQIPYKMGQMAVRDALRVINGEAGSIPEIQYQDTVLVTADNVDQIKPSDFYGPAADRF
ncbi:MULTISPECIES: substrate-binding domain-containing protein [unclassified Shinella]|uniref:substrate-binding domain-containing protein n=1 Tax=unclassified Shinella TaxID=2643062 RepID=UPI00225C55A5|nr:substrate-binding domain-containing protein [Shinella sp. YE25]MDC7258734.1 substrate-binding domain-containing protein [Shinella sp. YE25]CAI0334501.1 Ribose ABC transport system, periplasmic ribose-binding protein RbsB (TC 3.A.1.2.1) [Rhizobiaceae bacterium]CAK7260677.1 ribose transport system substrate-binding protein [Shinella sp. WSC3-e]